MAKVFAAPVPLPAAPKKWASSWKWENQCVGLQVKHGETMSSCHIVQMLILCMCPKYPWYRQDIRAANACPSSIHGVSGFLRFCLFTAGTTPRDSISSWSSEKVLDHWGHLPDALPRSGHFQNDLLAFSLLELLSRSALALQVTAFGAYSASQDHGSRWQSAVKIKGPIGSRF